MAVAPARLLGRVHQPDPRGARGHSGPPRRARRARRPAPCGRAGGAARAVLASIATGIAAVAEPLEDERAAVDAGGELGRKRQRDGQLALLARERAAWTAGSGTAAGNHVTPDAATSGVSIGVTTQCTRWRFSTSTRSVRRGARLPGSAELDLAVRHEHGAGRGRRGRSLQPAQVAERLLRQPRLELGLEPEEVGEGAALALTGVVADAHSSPPHFTRSIT